MAAARNGDQAAFGRLAEPVRHELQVHCYRMLGSVEDAEDAVQETPLRAWTRLGSFEGRAPLRAVLVLRDTLPTVMRGVQQAQAAEGGRR